MTIHDHRTDDITEEVREWLSREFASSLPASTVHDIVRSAHADLDGQIRPDAMGEMLHRLARFRVLRTLGNQSGASDRRAVPDTQGEITGRVPAKPFRFPRR